MKLTSFLAATALCMVAATSFAKGHRPISVLAVRNDLFYFKVDKAFIGARVEVYASSGELIFTDTIRHHKMLIDFFDKGEDNYTIKIKSQSTEVNYLYMKFDPVGVDAFKPAVKQI